MAVKVFIGKQTQEGVKATTLIDAGATDFNLAETVSKIQSEVFQSVAAKGDSHVSRIENGGGLPIEISKKILELILPGMSYKKTTNKYAMSTDAPAFYTIVLSDNDNNEKWEYIDCCIASLTIKLEMGAYVTADIEVIGKTSTVSTGTVAESVDTQRGPSLLALHSTVTIDGNEKTSSVESLDISINNGMEARGALNSQYTVKIKRANPQETSISLSMNEYDKALYSTMKNKMTSNANTTGTVTLGDGTGTGDITIELVKLFVSDNKRGDWKGSGTHDMSFDCSADNNDNTHLKFIFGSAVLSNEEE